MLTISRAHAIVSLLPRQYRNTTPENCNLAKIDTDVAAASVLNRDGIQAEVAVDGTIDFSSEITIPPNFTAERAENAETLEKPSGVLNTLKLCALCDLRVDKSLVFSIVPCGRNFANYG